MPERLKSLENRVEHLLRYIELLNKNLEELKEQVETRHNVDKVESIIHNIAQSFICRKTK